MQKSWVLRNFDENEEKIILQDLSNEADKFVNKWSKNDKYTKSWNLLKEALDDYESLMGKLGLGNEFIYSVWLKLQLNQSSSELKAKFNLIEDYLAKIQNKISFFVINLSKIETAKHQEILNLDIIKDYKHYLERIFLRSKHILSDKEEAILNLKYQTSYSSWVKMVEGMFSKEQRKVIDDKGNEFDASFEEILKLHLSKDKNVRDFAGNVFNMILKDKAEVCENQINSLVIDKKINDELRGFERPDKSRHLSDDIDSEVVESLIEVVSSKFNLSRDFYKIKAKLMNVNKMKYYERNLEVLELKKDFSYEKSFDLVYNSFNNLDSEFGKIFYDLHKNGQVDIFPSKGKRSGAFCISSSNNGKVFVLLNHSNNFQDLMTLAHEFGHAINGELMKSENNLNYDVPISTAEVASTFMENVVLGDLIKNSNGEERIYYIMQVLERFVSTVFRQIAFYKFELDLHNAIRNKGYLSIEEINGLFISNIKQYLGDSVDLSEAGLWWEYVPHFRDYFYVYSYSLGLLISKSMYKTLEENPLFISDIKKFFSSGTSKSPKEIFLDMGIDIFNKDFLKKGFEEFQILLEEVKRYLK